MEINAHNYKEVLLQWLEGELSPTEVLQAEAFILVNEAAAREWQLLKKTKLQPTEQVFFPRKSLLMREEEEVVVASVSAEKVIEQEAVVRTIGGGFNYRKFAFPLSIAASLLLFFFFFNNNKIVVKNENSPLAETTIAQPKANKETGNAESELAAMNDLKTDNQSQHSLINETGKINIEKQLAFGKEYNKNIKPAGKDKQPKAFSEDKTYVNKDTKLQEKADKQLALVKLDVPVVVAETGINKITKLKKSLAKQNQEIQKWQQTADEHKLALALGPDEQMERGAIGKLTHFFTKTVQIKKRTENDVNYYAFHLEAEKIKIVKTIKSNF